MAFHVRDPETDRLVRELARRRGIGLTEAIKLAARRELERDDQITEASLDQRLKALYARWDAMPRSGLEADKAFYDSLYEDD